MLTRKVPVNVRRRLAARMKELRGGRTQEEVIHGLAELGLAWSASKLSRIENNAQRIQPDEIEDLLELYGHQDAEELAKLKLWAKAARQRGRWDQVRADVPEKFLEFVEREEIASTLHFWEPLLVPALCQTREYAMALISGAAPDIDQQELERRADMRMSRQSELRRAEDPPELFVIIDESVLTRNIGGPDVMRGQLQHLKDMASWSNVTILVVPASVGAHPGLDGWFCLLEFPEPDDPAFAYTDGPGGNLYLEDPDDVRRCTLTFGHLCGIALNATETTAMLKRRYAELDMT